MTTSQRMREIYTHGCGILNLIPEGYNALGTTHGSTKERW